MTFGSINSAYLEGWVISIAYPGVLISQFESAMQQRCAPGWDQGAQGAQSQVGWSCLQFSHSDVISAVHRCVFTGLAQRDQPLQKKSQRKILPSCRSCFGDGK